MIKLTLSLTEEQFQQLKERAGLKSIQDYILSSLNLCDDNNVTVESLVLQALALPDNTSFELRDLAGWSLLPPNKRGAMGRAFYLKISKDENLSHIQYTGSFNKRSKGAIYIKTKKGD